MCSVFWVHLQGWHKSISKGSVHNHQDIVVVMPAVWHKIQSCQCSCLWWNFPGFSWLPMRDMKNSTFRFHLVYWNSIAIKCTILRVPLLSTFRTSIVAHSGKISDHCWCGCICNVVKKNKTTTMQVCWLTRALHKSAHAKMLWLALLLLSCKIF